MIAPARTQEIASFPADVLKMLRCPITGSALTQDGAALVDSSGHHRYDLTSDAIPLFAERLCTDDARAQQGHYDRIAEAYVANLSYPHTEEYMSYLDSALLDVLAPAPLGVVAEICCGHGEAMKLLGDRTSRCIGVDVSLSMLEEARRRHPDRRFSFVQGDATTMPLADETCDAVFMLGGVHHVNDRRGLFSEVSRILKPGGRFYFREPLSDFFAWRWIRAVVYRISPLLDNQRERPLLSSETIPVLASAGLQCEQWSTHGFFGFCLFMNSDVLVFNRLFRFIPGIRRLTRLAVRLDRLVLRIPGLRGAGLQVVGVAQKPIRR